MSRLRNPVVIAAIAVLLAVGGWLVFGYFGFQTILFDDEVAEAGPVFDSGLSADTAGAESPVDDDSGDGATDTASGEPATVTDNDDQGNGDQDNQDASTPSATGVAASTDAAATPVITTEYEGSFVDRSHPAEGIVTVLGDGTGQRFLRFEDFRTDNGPDLDVYLVRGVDAGSPESSYDDDFVDLGGLKGNVGDQNYEIPADVDLSEYDTVVIWCVRFGVAFGAADLAAT